MIRIRSAFRTLLALALAAPLLVAAGCGGSAAARPVDEDAARRALLEALEAWKGGEPHHALSRRPAPIRVADEEIIAASRQRSDALPMGTTVVVARIVQASSPATRFEVAWVGDSRVYLWRDGKLAQLSQDHSYVRELIEGGEISVEQARTHPQRNVVTQALGVTLPQDLNVETMSGEFGVGMQLLLCSDGLTEEVPDARIAAILARQDCSAQETVDELVSAALDDGGSDNVTAIVIRRA